MKLLCLSESDMRAALPMRGAIEVMKTAFAALSTGVASAPPRGVVKCPESDGLTLLMGANVPGTGLAAKVVSIFQGNEKQNKRVVNGLVLVLNQSTGEPEALLDGTFLTAWRTGASTGAATDLLARPDARVGVMIGCGAQARTQVLGIDSARQLDCIRVCGRSGDRVAAFVDELQPHVDARLEVAESRRAAVEEADVVCTATTSYTPVFEGAWLKAGAHVNGIGSFTREMRELDHVTVARARIVVDAVEAAANEAGDLLFAERSGHTKRTEWVELGLIAAGQAAGRQSDEEITLFKSVGHAVQDVAASARAVKAARERGLGKEIEL